MRRQAGLGSALAAGSAALLAALGVSLFLGAGSLPAAAVLPALVGRGEPAHVSIILDLRLARALLAAVCGASLATAGVVVQGLFRNPLADPFVMGISGGSALGAVAAIALGFTGSPATTAAAFGGGLAAAAAAYHLSRIEGRHPITTLLLAGFAIGAFCASVMAVLLLLTRQGSDEVVRWLFGSCARYDAWSRVGVAAPLALVAAGVALLRGRELDVMSTGDEAAQQLGVDVERAKGRLLAAAAVLTAAAVAMCGIIGFVGLIVPHVARRWMGPGHRRLLPVAALLGGALLVTADLAARTVLPPYELPVGALTALLGGPFFLALLRRSA